MMQYRRFWVYIVLLAFYCTEFLWLVPTAVLAPGVTGFASNLLVG